MNRFCWLRYFLLGGGVISLPSSVQMLLIDVFEPKIEFVCESFSFVGVIEVFGISVLADFKLSSLVTVLAWEVDEREGGEDRWSAIPVFLHIEFAKLFIG